MVLGANGNYFMAGNAGNNGKSVTFKASMGTNGHHSPRKRQREPFGRLHDRELLRWHTLQRHERPRGRVHHRHRETPTHFTISAAATGRQHRATTLRTRALCNSLVSASPAAVTTSLVADTSKLVPGMPLSGTGFAAGSYISSVTDATHFVASAATTAPTSARGSYTASVSNSMLSDDTGVQMIPKV